MQLLLHEHHVLLYIVLACFLCYLHKANGKKYIAISIKLIEKTELNRIVIFHTYYLKNKKESQIKKRVSVKVIKSWNLRKILQNKNGINWNVVNSNYCKNSKIVSQQSLYIKKKKKTEIKTILSLRILLNCHPLCFDDVRENGIDFEVTSHSSPIG